MAETSGCGWIGNGDRALDALLRHLPLGAAWIAWRTPGKTAYKMMTAFGYLCRDAWDAICRMARELDPRTTDEMMPEWETALGLPDPCLPQASTLEERRVNVMFRLAKRRWTSEADWHDLAALFGLVIKITPGWLAQKPALYDFCYPKRYDLYPKLGRFRVYVDIVEGCNAIGYAYSYPASYNMNAGNCTAFMCLIDRLRPSNVVVIWNATPEICGET